MGGMGAAHARRGVDFIRGLRPCDSGALYHDAGLCGSTRQRDATCRVPTIDLGCVDWGRLFR